MRADLLPSPLFWAQLEYAGVNHTGTRAKGDLRLSASGNPAWVTRAPGAAARGLLRAKAAPEPR